MDKPDYTTAFVIIYFIIYQLLSDIHACDSRLLAGTQRPGNQENGGTQATNHAYKLTYLMVILRSALVTGSHFSSKFSHEVRRLQYWIVTD